MSGLKKLERLLTRHFVLSTASVVVLVLGGISSLLILSPARIDDIGKAVDITLKSVAVILGGAWALNRYFTLRTDELQIRVDADIQAIPAGSFKEAQNFGLLNVHLNIVNTGKSLIPQFGQRLIIRNVYPTPEREFYDQLYDWPEAGLGLHQTCSIEPGSWSAVNISRPISTSTLAVNVYLEIYIGEARKWTWHKTFGLKEQLL